jgi:hypothetical protein
MKSIANDVLLKKRDGVKPSSDLGHSPPDRFLTRGCKTSRYRIRGWEIEMSGRSKEGVDPDPYQEAPSV